jgi:hypothetical protein
VKRFLRTFVLFSICLGLMGLALFVMPGSQLAVPAGVAGFASFLLALG